MRAALTPYALNPPQRLVQYFATRLMRDDLRIGRFVVQRDVFGMDAGGAHGTVTDIREAIGPERFRSYFKFAFVRNPWDRMVSFYHFNKLRPRSRRYKIAMRHDLNGFILELKERGGMRCQLDYITDESGEIVVDCVGRFETLGEDFTEICRRIGIESRLPHRNRSRSTRHLSEYSDEGRLAVAEMFRRDIDEFGYTFD